jgi:DNA primase
VKTPNNGRRGDGLADAVRAYVASDAVAAFQLVLGSPPVPVSYGKKGEAYWPCRFHDDSHPSFRLNPAKQSWWCDPCGLGGDIFDLVERLNNCTFRGALHWLAERFNLNNGHNGSPARQKPRSNREQASAIWADSSPATGTPTETYVRARGITSKIPACIRHAQLKHGPTNQELPAMVVAVTDGEDGVCAVHRTYLRADGTGKADVPRKQQKLALGPVGIGVVRFSPTSDKVAYLEGVENALTIEQAKGIPARAFVGAFRTPIVEDSIVEVYLAADRDPNGNSERHARKAGAELLAKKPQLRVFLTQPRPRPDGGKADFNDVLRERGNQGVCEEFDAGLEQLTAATPLLYRPPSSDFIFDKMDPGAMLQEVRRRFAYLKEQDSVADLDDYLIRSQDGFTSYASKYNALEPHPTNSNQLLKVTMPARWRECPERIELVKPVYEPCLTFPICEIDGRLFFNQWRGFAAEPIESDVSKLLAIVDHIYQDLPEEREHFLQFHAYARQNPGQKIMHALMLISRQQGIGKSLAGEIIGHGLWGERNFAEVEHGHLGASFNSFLKHKKFILANEMLLSSLTSDAMRT